MNAIGRRSLLTGFVAGLAVAGGGRLAGAATAPLRMAYSETAAPFSSRGDDGRPRGLLVDGMELVGRESGVAMTHQAYPWARCQLMLQRGDMDGFCTVPTDEREAYMRFSSVPLVVIQYGIFHRIDDHRLAKVRSIADLAPFTQGNYAGHGWAKQYLQGQTVQWEPDEKTVLTMIARGYLDIYVGAEIRTWHWLRVLGLADRFAVTPAPFLPPANFSFGLRRDFPAGDRVVATIEVATQKATDDGRLERLIATYRP